MNLQIGSTNIYRYEDFSNGIPSFSIRSDVNPSPSVLFIPKNYKNDNLNLAEIGSLSGYPTVSYSTDFYNSWLAQNSALINLSLQQDKFNYEINQTKTALNGASNTLSNIKNLDAFGTVGSASSTRH